RSVAPITLNIAFGKVAGIKPRLSSPIAANGKRNMAVRLVEQLRQLRLREIARQTALANQQSLHPYIDVLQIEIDTRVSSRHNDPAPVRIAASDGCLHQWRIPNNTGNPHGFFIGTRPINIDCNE